jgi:hypothetical protein
MDLDDFLGEPRGSVRFAVFISENQTERTEPQYLTKISNFYYIPKFHFIISFIHTITVIMCYQNFLNPWLLKTMNKKLLKKNHTIVFSNISSWII